MAGTLYVVATPIGNLEDLSLRALRVLREVALIAAEDTRVTRVLLDRHEIQTPLVSHHAHSSEAARDALLARLDEGASIALVSDAGTPLLSDPGAELVRAAIERHAAVVPIPGPSALLAAVVGAGVPASRFVFLGFLPKKDGERRELLAPLRSLPLALVIYEAPQRIAATLAALREDLGDREAAVARELTKRFETFERGRLGALAERLSAGVKGEVVIVVAPPEPTDAVDLEAARAEVLRLLEHEGPARVAKLIAGRYGLTKRDAYALVMEAKGG